MGSKRGVTIGVELVASNIFVVPQTSRLQQRNYPLASKLSELAVFGGWFCWFSGTVTTNNVFILVEIAVPMAYLGYDFGRFSSTTFDGLHYKPGRRLYTFAHLNDMAVLRTHHISGLWWTSSDYDAVRLLTLDYIIDSLSEKILKDMISKIENHLIKEFQEFIKKNLRLDIY